MSLENIEKQIKDVESKKFTADKALLGFYGLTSIFVASGTVHIFQRDGVIDNIGVGLSAVALFEAIALAKDLKDKLDSKKLHLGLLYTKKFEESN